MKTIYSIAIGIAVGLCMAWWYAVNRIDNEPKTVGNHVSTYNFNGHKLIEATTNFTVTNSEPERKVILGRTPTTVNLSIEWTGRLGVRGHNRPYEIGLNSEGFLVWRTNHIGEK